MLTIIESGAKAWAVAATNGDVRIFSREQAGEWIEVLLSEDSEQIDADGSLILEAMYEQQPGRELGEQREEPGDEGDEVPEGDEDEEPEAEEDEQPEAEEDEEPEAEEDAQPEAEEDEPEEKPRRSRGRAKARKK